MSTEAGGGKIEKERKKQGKFDKKAAQRALLETYDISIGDI